MLVHDDTDQDTRSLDSIHKEAAVLVEKIQGDLDTIDLVKDLMLESLAEINFGAHILGNIVWAPE